MTILVPAMVPKCAMTASIVLILRVAVVKILKLLPMAVVVIVHSWAISIPVLIIF